MNSKRNVIVARELTTQEIEVAKILKDAWLKKKSTNKSLSQEKLAELMGLTQGGTSHYLNAIRPIGLETLIKFCSVLDVNVLDVYPGLLKNEVKDTAQALEFLSLFLKADEGVQNGVLAILRSGSS